jgi:imidazolonepropionase
LKNNAPIPIKATFLGAHAYPLAYRERKSAYVDLVVNEMLPAVAKEQLADYVDVFCEEGFFSLNDTRRVVEAAAKFGMKPRLHVNQLTSSGGLQLAVELGAISADHLEMMTEEDISCIATSSTIATLLPTAAYFLRAPFPPARKLIEVGAAVAIASDFNPGSSPNGNMQHVVNMACIQMKMTPEEAFQAATFQGACAMELQHEVGSIAVGKLANFIITKPIPSLAYIPYSFGENHIQDVVIRGRFLSEE